MTLLEKWLECGTESVFGPTARLCLLSMWILLIWLVVDGGQSLQTPPLGFVLLSLAAAGPLLLLLVASLGKTHWSIDSEEGQDIVVRETLVVLGLPIWKRQHCLPTTGGPFTCLKHRRRQYRVVDFWGAWTGVRCQTERCAQCVARTATRLVGVTPGSGSRSERA